MINNFLLIPAAGKGSRSGLNYPKTLFKYKNNPILINIIKNVFKTNIKFSKVIIIVSPKGKNKIKECLIKYNLIQKCELIIQHQPKGMADSVYQIKKSKYVNMYSSIYLIWGDLAYPDANSLNELYRLHIYNKNDFSFLTKNVQNPYTIVNRVNNKVVEVLETKSSQKKISYGERDTGIFVFKLNKIYKYLTHIEAYKNQFNYEKSFLGLIKNLVIDKCLVEAYISASDNDILSLNRVKDIKI